MLYSVQEQWLLEVSWREREALLLLRGYLGLCQQNHLCNSKQPRVEKSGLRRGDTVAIAAIPTHPITFFIPLFPASLQRSYHLQFTKAWHQEAGADFSVYGMSLHSGTMCLCHVCTAHMLVPPVVGQLPMCCSNYKNKFNAKSY